MYSIIYVVIKGRLHQIRWRVRTKRPILSAGRNNVFYQASKVLFQAINIGDVHVIITLVSAKQVYSGKVKLFNKIEPFHLQFCFHFAPPFSHVPIN